MPRTLFAVSLVFMVAANAVLAGPPEGPSRKTVLDELADGLRQYRQARTEPDREALLNRLAPIHDPRVAVFLGEIATDEKSPLWLKAGFLFNRYHIPEDWTEGGLKYTSRSYFWWKENEADLRRRARDLP